MARQFAVDQIRAHRAAGFKVLVVDASPLLSARRESDWDCEATCWLHRANQGYDFGSYREGLGYLQRLLGAASECFVLIFANDSCFGPFVPLAPLIERFDAYPDGESYVFGITDSLQGGVHHLQSYWLYFRADVCALAVEFFAGMTAALNRDEAVEFGELGLGRFLLAKQCRLIAACPVLETVAELALGAGWIRSIAELSVRRIFKRWRYNRAADTQCLRHLLRRSSKIHFFNPAVLFAVPLVLQGKLPFVKRSLFSQNAYCDRVVPADIDNSVLDNAQVKMLFKLAS